MSGELLTETDPMVVTELAIPEGTLIHQPVITTVLSSDTSVAGPVEGPTSDSYQGTTKLRGAD
jgi:hypothetical protein